MRGSGVTGGARGGRVPPRDFWLGIFTDVSGKKRQGKKGKGVKIEKKRSKIVKGKGGILEMEVGKGIKSVRKWWGPFFFFFFFFFFHFWKRRKFVLPKWKFPTGKKHFTPGKKSGKMTLPPQKNMPVTPLMRVGLLTNSKSLKLLWHFFTQFTLSLGNFTSLILILRDSKKKVLSRDTWFSGKFSSLIISCLKTLEAHSLKTNDWKVNLKDCDYRERS